MECNKILNPCRKYWGKSDFGRTIIIDHEGFNKTKCMDKIIDFLNCVSEKI